MKRHEHLALDVDKLAISEGLLLRRLGRMSIANKEVCKEEF